MRSSSWFTLVCPALVVAWAGVACAESKKVDKIPTFAQVVEDRFARWDLDFDGNLTPKEVSALVLSAKVTGDQAAALAAIHVYLRNHPDVFSLSKDFLLRNHLEAPAGRRDQGQKGAYFSSRYSSFREHIRRSPREVFATKESPGLVGIAQGGLGDCYFLASVIAAIHANQPAFRQMFQPAPDGSCTVQFHGGHRVHVRRLTDAEIALSSSAGDQGVWLNVAEKAFCEIRQEARKQRKRFDDKLVLDGISHGGYTPEAIEVLCGTQARAVVLRKGEQPPRAEDLPRLKTELHDHLSSALRRRLVFCCATGHGSKLPPGIASDHAYAILSYDARAQVVTLMNPWGNQFEPDGAAGIDHGYVTSNGKFAMPLDDFVRTFEAMYFQTSLPLSPKRR